MIEPKREQWITNKWRSHSGVVIERQGYVTLEIKFNGNETRKMRAAHARELAAAIIAAAEEAEKNYVPEEEEE
jgi:hypothetical protein